MVEWWQAILIAVSASTVTGVFAWLVSFYQSRWSADAARAADERHESGRISAEGREIAREQRGKRVEPFYAFLNVAGRYLTQGDSREQFEAAWDRNLGNVQATYRAKEQFLDDMVPHVGEPMFSELQELMREVLSTTNDPNLIRPYQAVLLGMSPGADPLASYKAMQDLRDALEHYIRDG